MKKFCILRFVTLIAIAISLTLVATAQVQKTTYRAELPFDWYLTPTDYPCLNETIHVTGTYQEFATSSVNPGGGFHYSLHQIVSVTGMGLSTEQRYVYSGPFTNTINGAVDQNYAVEASFVNHNHFVGAGQNPNLTLRTIVHLTLNPETGEFKAEVRKDDVLCR